MPQIFDEARREALRIKILENGFDLIKKYGLKKTSISDIAKISGIATGTFYNFFKTKEDFVYQIVIYKRNAVKKKMSLLFEQKEKVNREQMNHFLKELFTEDNDIFMYLNETEVAQLHARWPAEYLKNESKDEQTTCWILSHLSPVNENCNWKVVANLFKSIHIIKFAKVRLHQDYYEETLDVFIESILGYVFVKQ